jgi:hydroxyethylthiazole kinase-like uncharacterized protein yjeF
VIQLALGSFGSVTLPDQSVRSLATPSSSEMAHLDAVAIAAGTSGLELMERAGLLVADEARKLAKVAVEKTSIVIMCGPGNNGGDGLVVARALQTDGYNVTAVLAHESRYSNECLAQAAHVKGLRMLTSGDRETSPISALPISEAELSQALAQASLVVDALLGTGQRDAPRGSIASLVRLVAHAKSSNPDLKVLSVDVPTGICADTGRVFEPHIVAHLTVSIELLKRGTVQFPARDACGLMKVVSIGIDARSSVRFALALGENLPAFHPRALDAHKGSFGKVLVIGGSAAMPGASVLAALGALRSGVPLVTRATRAGWLSPEIPPECMHALIPGEAPYYQESDLEAVLEHASKADVVVLGPGLGRHPETGAFTRQLVRGLVDAEKGVVIDADALYHCAHEGVSFHGARIVITPHPGEAAVLLEQSTAEVQGDRFASVEALQSRFGGVALLKGAGTLVYDGKSGYIIPRGTPYLATGGSGDVLSGIIAACLSRGLSMAEATVAGAYIHAVAGEKASMASGGPIIASDIAWAAASVFGDLEK